MGPTRHDPSSRESRDVYFSIDIETSGPNPGLYSLLTVGACLVDDPHRALYLEVQPVTDVATPAALAITGLTLEELRGRGLPPERAMAAFAAWVEEQVPEGGRAIFVSFNAPFDWMFVCDYFHRYLGRNPFGHSAIDIKAVYMGLTGAPWTETSFRFVATRYGRAEELTHHALADARDQAALFRSMLEESESHGFSWL
jgi:DNA polymerase III epsilon subunit-like protein